MGEDMSPSTEKRVSVTVTAKPLGYENDLSDFQPVLYDGNVCIGWGHRILKTLGVERFEALREYGALCVVGRGRFMRGGHADWALITFWLTPKQAIEVYGHVTNIERGPQGGFKSITYGKTKFRDRRMLPKEEVASSKQPVLPDFTEGLK